MTSKSSYKLNGGGQVVEAFIAEVRVILCELGTAAGVVGMFIEIDSVTGTGFGDGSQVY